jgi:very-short-patch-repair endonuclease
MKYSEIKETASKLRRNPTKEEELLWRYLRKHKLKGYKFLRQHPIIYESTKDEYFYFIPDFYCSKLKLAIELDGAIHKKTIAHDKKRDEILISLGIKILRLRNEELTNVEKVLNKIEQAMKL